MRVERGKKGEKGGKSLLMFCPLTRSLVFFVFVFVLILVTFILVFLFCLVEPLDKLFALLRSNKCQNKTPKQR